MQGWELTIHSYNFYFFKIVICKCIVLGRNLSGVMLTDFELRDYCFAFGRNLGDVMLTDFEQQCYYFASGWNLGGVRLTVDCIKILLFKSNFCKWFHCVLPIINLHIIKLSKIKNIDNDE